MNIFLPIDSNTGYGISGYNLWKSLYETNKELCLFVIGGITLENHWDRDGILKCLNHNKSLFNKHSPSFKLWHDNDFFTKPASSGTYGGLSFFELDSISAISKKSYDVLDIIFTPSKWAKQVLIDNGIDANKIIVSPQGVDTSVFYPTQPETKDKNKYIFINIGKFEIRKGHDLLPSLFNNAFNENDDVELWMINHNPFLNKEQMNEWYSLYANTKLGNKIKFFSRIPTQKDLANIMNHADCGIFPCRAEGWNNEAIELLATNKPLIITDYSAQTEFCNKDNSYLIDIHSKCKAIDNIWFRGEGNWAFFDEKSIEQTIEHMRYVYKNNIRTNENGLKTANEFKWSKTAKIINDNLSMGV